MVSLFLTVAVVLFAFSTMISWSYYGLQAMDVFIWSRSKAADYALQVIILYYLFIGAAASLESVSDFSDAMIFAMVVPNYGWLYSILLSKSKKNYKDILKL